MEPSSVEDGNQALRQREITEKYASMEPSSVEDGNLVYGEASCVVSGASMEPSSVEDGNAFFDNPQCGRIWLLQWSRPQLRTETAQAPRSKEFGSSASMEPSSVEDGNVANGGRWPARFRCFNGAVLS